MPARNSSNGNSRRVATPQNLNSLIWGICDLMRPDYPDGAIDYIPELSWLLFLRVLDERESGVASRSVATGQSYRAPLVEPYRWRDWAFPAGSQRLILTKSGRLDSFRHFVNSDLLPTLRGLRDLPLASPRQKVISQIVAGVQQVGFKSDKAMLDVLDRLDQIKEADTNTSQMFTLSQVYEGILPRLGEGNSNSGQFFTPRQVIKAMVRVIDPQPGETVYDPCCGTGGFLAESHDHLYELLEQRNATANLYEQLKERTFYGREKSDSAYVIGLANLALHGIDFPSLWHGNTLDGSAIYDGLWQNAPDRFDVILTNPPFGGKEHEHVSKLFPYRSRATQILFLQHILTSLKSGGRCGIVVDEGVLFRTNEEAFVKTKKKLLDDCDLWCVVSMPAGLFAGAGAGVKTDLLFFTKGQRTEQVWYYDLSDIKVTKKQPFTLEVLEDDGNGLNFYNLLAERADSARSWTISRAEIEARNYDLKAVNPNRVREQDTRTPDELLELIEAKGREVAEALARLRSLGL